MPNAMAPTIILCNTILNQPVSASAMNCCWNVLSRLGQDYGSYRGRAGVSEPA